MLRIYILYGIFCGKLNVCSWKTKISTALKIIIGTTKIHLPFVTNISLSHFLYLYNTSIGSIFLSRILTGNRHHDLNENVVVKYFMENTVSLNDYNNVWSQSDCSQAQNSQITSNFLNFRIRKSLDWSTWTHRRTISVIGSNPTRYWIVGGEFVFLCMFNVQLSLYTQDLCARKTDVFQRITHYDLKIVSRHLLYEEHFFLLVLCKTLKKTLKTLKTSGRP